MGITVKFAWLLGSTALLSSSVAMAVHFKLTKEQIKTFDDGLVQSEETTCKSFDQNSKDPKIDEAFQNWLASEVKKLSEIEPTVGSGTKFLWDEDLTVFKINGESVEGLWEPKSPGTFGKVFDNKLKFANDDDGKTLKAPVVDVATCVLSDLQPRTDLENKIWLVEQSPLIPSLVALSMEAKLHKALAIIIYGENKATLDEPGVVAALPIVRVNSATAKKIKGQLKEKDATAELILRTNYPVTTPERWLFVKKGTRDVNLAITANSHDCKAVSILLGLIDWARKSEESVEATVFGFYSDDGQEKFGDIASEIKIDPASFEPLKFLNSWIKSDQDIANLIDGKKILQKALENASNFQGLVDKESLDLYKTRLRQLEGVVKSKPDVAFQLKRIYEPDPITDLALDLKNLRQVHDLAQRGQWEKAVRQFQKIHDYDWASNISTPIFVEYKKVMNTSTVSVDPQLWVELQKGRDHLDGFIDAVESEIDRLDKKLSDNFFKIHKSIENLDKI